MNDKTKKTVSIVAGVTFGVSAVVLGFLGFTSEQMNNYLALLGSATSAVVALLSVFFANRK